MNGEKQEKAKNNFIELKVCAKYIFKSFWLSVLLILVVEILSRHSVTKGFSFVWHHPFLILYSAMIVDALFSLALLFQKRDFVRLLVAAGVLFLGAANCVLLLFRITPLAATDFELITSVFEIMHVYLKLWQIALIAVFIIGLAAVLIRGGIKSKKQPRSLPASMICIALLYALLLSITFVGDRMGILKKRFPNMPVAYEENGFVYCFSRSLLDRGIDKPEEYSPETIEDILDAIGSEHTKKASDKPNIIFLQLESFVDLRRLKGLSFSENPQPVFSKLRDSCRGGYLTVPSVGAGTANTEFAILSGMNLAYFGTGEYPYKTVLLDTTCESLAYNLRENGYHSTVVHNHEGNFYDRNRVFANLGFDNFVSIEYMNNIEYNPLGWAKDNILTQQIMNALHQNQQRDLICAITVQDHGKYPEEPIDEPRIFVSGFSPEEEEEKNQMEYYVNQCHETDEFIGYLISVLDNFNEPVILVMYGDHFPNLDLTDEDLTDGNIYQTEYVIWANESRRKQKAMTQVREDLQAYQLSATLLEYLGMNNGILTKFHQKYRDYPDYEENLEMLQYDMLYGERDVYGGQQLYKTADMKMGIAPIVINNVSFVGDTVYVMGENFTKSSVIYKNDREQETVFIDKNTLMTTDEKAQAGDWFYVAQKTHIGIELSRTESYQKK